MHKIDREELILVGGGGHCKACIDVILLANLFRIRGIIDLKENIGKTVIGVPIIDCDDNILKYKKTKNALVSAGFAKSNKLRKQLFLMVAKVFELPIIISPKAYKAYGVNIGHGSIIMHDAILNTFCSIGENTVINTKALIEHDAKVGDHCHIATGAIVNGDCIIGNDVMLGSNSCIIQGLKISDSVVIGAGSVVTKDIVESGVYIGTPARKIRDII